MVHSITPPHTLEPEDRSRLTWLDDSEWLPCDAQVVKRVSKDCADASFHEAVEAADGSHGCFAGCNGGAETPCFLRFSHLKRSIYQDRLGQTQEKLRKRAVSAGVRNTSSPCWIRCFEETMLGKAASKPGAKRPAFIHSRPSSSRNTTMSCQDRLGTNGSKIERQGRFA
jgi:hypothetical protein